MTTQSTYIPFNMQSLWEMNRNPLGNFETTFRTWCDFSGQVHEHANKFMSSRLAKDTAALAQLGQCKTSMDALNVQMTYLTGAYADYMNKGQKIVGFFGDVARDALPGILRNRRRRWAASRNGCRIGLRPTEKRDRIDGDATTRELQWITAK